MRFLCWVLAPFSRFVLIDLGLVGCSVVADDTKRHILVLGCLVLNANQSESDIALGPDFRHITFLHVQAVRELEVGNCFVRQQVLWFYHGFSVVHENVDDVCENVGQRKQEFLSKVFLVLI